MNGMGLEIPLFLSSSLLIMQSILKYEISFIQNSDISAIDKLPEKKELKS